VTARSRSPRRTIDIAYDDVPRIDTGKVRYGSPAISAAASPRTITLPSRSASSMRCDSTISQATIGNVNAADRGNRTGSCRRPSPATADRKRKIVVSLRFVRAAGSSIDGYADNHRCDRPGSLASTATARSMR
jgi:hypothetical protein